MVMHMAVVMHVVVMQVARGDACGRGDASDGGDACGGGDTCGSGDPCGSGDASGTGVACGSGDVYGDWSMETGATSIEGHHRPSSHVPTNGCQRETGNSSTHRIRSFHWWVSGSPGALLSIPFISK